MTDSITILLRLTGIRRIKRERFGAYRVVGTNRTFAVVAVNTGTKIGPWYESRRRARTIAKDMASWQRGLVLAAS